jgi:hypothetical protein
MYFRLNKASTTVLVYDYQRLLESHSFFSFILNLQELLEHPTY